MSDNWTVERILALSPSAASAGRSLASARYWSELGKNESVLWGGCQGSGKDPYQVQIIPTEPPAFKCSCPAFRNAKGAACKHIIGLFLLSAQSPAAFQGTTPPAWVTNWLASRTERAEKKSEKAVAAASDPDVAKKSAGRATKAAGDRAGKVAAGMAELELWLSDLIRQGLAAAQSRPNSYWAGMAARMVDAQAPGVARWVRRLAGIPASGEGWQDRLLDRLVRLYLLLEGFKRMDRLPQPVQADIRATLGFTQRKEDVLHSQPAIRDRWFVLGVAEEEEENLCQLRTWLRGLDTGRYAVVYTYAYGNAPLDRSATPGMTFDGELVYYPSAAPMRAEFKSRTVVPSPGTMPGCVSVAEAYSAASTAWSAQPWLELFPFAVTGLTPLRVRDSRGNGDRWLFRDTVGDVLSTDARFQQGWDYMAVSGGAPIPVFGEWDGERLLPLQHWPANGVGPR